MGICWLGSTCVLGHTISSFLLFFPWLLMTFLLLMVFNVVWIGTGSVFVNNLKGSVGNVQIHTYIHTYTDTYIHTYMLHTYINTYIPTYMHAYNTYIRTCMARSILATYVWHCLLLRD